MQRASPFASSLSSQQHHTLPASVHFATVFYFRILCACSDTRTLRMASGHVCLIPFELPRSSAPGSPMSHVRKSEHLSSVSEPRAAPTSPSPSIPGQESNDSRCPRQTTPTPTKFGPQLLVTTPSSAPETGEISSTHLTPLGSPQDS